MVVECIQHHQSSPTASSTSAESATARSSSSPACLLFLHIVQLTAQMVKERALALPTSTSTTTATATAATSLALATASAPVQAGSVSEVVTEVDPVGTEELGQLLEDACGLPLRGVEVVGRVRERAGDILTVHLEHLLSLRTPECKKHVWKIRGKRRENERVG